MKQRIYIDTSVFGGYFDSEFDIPSQKLFQRIVNKDFLVYFSDINEAELLLAPQHIRDIQKLIPLDCFTFIEVNDEVETFASTYIFEKILGKASENDAYHIALSAVHRVDCLISWNFKHIVNYHKIKMFNAINIRMGYPMIDIRSPFEFTKDE
ncbi:MAG: hypothetical protein NW207_12675 [Cytophagales bacterium]|nr:hypothetical protein [Cytophagales bacterium]